MSKKQKQKRAEKKAARQKKHPKVQNFKRKLHKAAKKLNPKAAPYVDLLPFKKMMIKQLDRNGISHSSEIDDVAKKFLNHIIRKRNFADRHSFSSIGKSSETFNIVEEVAEGVVKAIISFIRELKQRKKAADAGVDPPLPPAESEMLDDAEDGVKEASDVEDKDEEKNGSWISNLLDKIFPRRVQNS